MAEKPTLEIDVGGQALLLHAERAVIWPARRTVLIADLHLGKSELFRRTGLAAPEGSSADDLRRLDALVEGYDAERIVLLGDFVHASFTQQGAHERLFTAWREQRARVQFMVIAGNHDRRAAGRTLASVVEWCGLEAIDGPFVYRHHPSASPHGYVLCGHTHPVTSMRASRRERVRAPVFWRRAECLVLPAFGGFTGGAEVEAAPEDRLYAIAGGAVWALPAS